MSCASNHAPHIRGMFHLFWGLFYWETCLPAFCASNHLFKLRPHFDRHRVIGYSFAFLRLCCLWPLGSLPVCSRRLALENVPTSFRSHSGHTFPAWTWEDYTIYWVFLPFSTLKPGSWICHKLSYGRASDQACTLSVDSHTLAQHPAVPPIPSSWLLGLSSHTSTLLPFTWLHVFSSKALLYEERLFYNFFLQTSNLANPLFVKLTYTYKKEMEITCHWWFKVVWHLLSKPAQSRCVVSLREGTRSPIRPLSRPRLTYFRIVHS